MREGGLSTAKWAGQPLEERYRSIARAASTRRMKVAVTVVPRSATVSGPKVCEITKVEQSRAIFACHNQKKTEGETPTPKKSRTTVLCGEPQPKRVDPTKL